MQYLYQAHSLYIEFKLNEIVADSWVLNSSNLKYHVKLFLEY